MNYPTLSADELRFENELNQESGKDLRPSNHSEDSALQEPSVLKKDSVTDIMEESMILGR